MSIQYVVLNRSDDTFWGYIETLNSINSSTQYAIAYNATKDPETANISYYVGLKNTAATATLDSQRVTENANAKTENGSGSQGVQGPAGGGTVLRQTYTVDLPALSANAEFIFDVTVTGAVLQDIVTVTPPIAFLGYFTIMGWVQSADLVRIQIRNLSSYIDRTSETWTIGIIKANATGAVGVQGSQGLVGTMGAQGPIGVIGNQGANGNQGTNGNVGAQGFVGGAQGYQGVAGTSGSSTHILKTTSSNANVGDSLLIDTTLGAITITLPISPIIGDSINFIDACIGANTFELNNLIVVRNGKNIMGLAEDLIINIGKISFTLFYNGTEWRLI